MSYFRSQIIPEINTGVQTLLDFLKNPLKIMVNTAGLGRKLSHIFSHKEGDAL
jgi:fumarate reductase subunit C